MQVAHKIELKPNNKQKTYFAKACGVSRFVWNWALAEWNRQYYKNEENIKNKKQKEYKINGLALKKQFNAIKHIEFPWLKEVTKYAAQQPFIELQKSYSRFFKKLSFNKPRFKKKNKSKDSFYIGGDQIKISDKKIWVPKLGYVRLKEKLRFKGKIHSVTISRDSNRWFASVQVDVKSLSLKIDKQGKSVGVDLGINTMASLSDGTSFTSPKPLKKKLRRLRRVQRKLHKKKKGSKNRFKQLKKVRKQHYKIANIRKDTSHKTTSFICSNYTNIAIEDLNVRGMVKNHNLARSIQDIGFYEFRRQLEYKTKWRGTNVILVNRFFPSSKMCSSCGKVNKDITLKDRIFQCECGFILDRDINAAINLQNQIGKALPKFTPVEMTAIQKSVHPVFVTSIYESGSELQTA